MKNQENQQVKTASVGTLMLLVLAVTAAVGMVEYQQKSAMTQKSAKKAESLAYQLFDKKRQKPEFAEAFKKNKPTRSVASQDSEVFQIGLDPWNEPYQWTWVDENHEEIRIWSKGPDKIDQTSSFDVSGRSGLNDDQVVVLKDNFKVSSNPPQEL